MSERHRTWRVRIAFEPNRFSSDQLVKVYEQLKPTNARSSPAQPSSRPTPTKRSAAKGGER
jgi:hypothetical protein